MLITFITESQVKTVKSDLLHQCREHKIVTSSHLSEALAFAFGFNTNAAMLLDFEGAKTPQCVEFCAERFLHRLSVLSGISLPKLQSVFNTGLAASVSRATGTRDLRQKIVLPSSFKACLDKFFKLMADHGAAYFTTDTMRIPPTDFGFSGSYRPGRQAMRSSFTQDKPSDYWQWDDSDWSALLADDFLADYAGSECNLLSWASIAHGLLEPDLRLGNVVFDAEIGLVVHHEVIAGCTASILYQRPGQLEEVRDSDVRQRNANLLTA